jgi:hypothetical protein
MTKVIDIRQHPIDEIKKYLFTNAKLSYSHFNADYPYVGVDIDGAIIHSDSLEDDLELIDLPQELDDAEALLESTLKSNLNRRELSPGDQVVISRHNITLTSVEQVRKTSANRIFPSEVTSYEIKVGVRLNRWIEFEMNIFSQAPMSEDEIIDRVLYKLRLG